MTEPALEAMVEMHRWIWRRFKDSLDGVTPEEADWRPLPEANNINLILRHLRIEAEYHLAALERGEPMPVQLSESVQRRIDVVTLDFFRNLQEIEERFTRFITLLEGTTLSDLRLSSERAYQEYPPGRPRHLLAFHQVMHLTQHWGQIRTIRNLYCKTRGQPARFFPDNPMFPVR